MNIIITTTMESVAADMTMNIIITTTTESVAADMTMNIIITTTMESVVVDTTMTMDTTMQMMYLQAGELRLPTNLQRKNLRTLYQNLQATNHLVMFSVLKELLLQMRESGSILTLYLKRQSLEEAQQTIQEEYA